MADSPFQDIDTKNYRLSESSPKKRSIKPIVFAVLALFIIGGVVLGAFQFFGNSETVEEEEETSPTPTDYVFPTDTPSPTVEAETTPSPVKASASPSPKPTTNPKDKATGLDRSTISIEIQNGSGVVGAASKGSEILKGFGYKISNTKNADNFDYEKTVILVKSDKNAFIALLKKDLEGSYVIGSASATLSASESADAVVIIGKE